MKIENIFIKYIKLRNKLNEGKIYKIVDNTNDNVYIGSTCKTLKTRLSVHKCHYKMFLKGLYNNVKSFEIIKNNDYKIELLEKCDIKTKQELLARERFYIENNNCLNKVIPGRTDKQYYIHNKNELTIKKKEKFICQCRGKYTRCHKSQHINSNKHQNYLKSQNK